MKIEHIAFNVADPVAVAAWYADNVGLSLAFHNPAANQTHFLSDGAGSIIEIYCNPADQVPDYRRQDPLIFHLALASEDPRADAARLIEKGAEFVEEKAVGEAMLLIMLRDPWGHALQLCKRPPAFFKA